MKNSVVEYIQYVPNINRESNRQENVKSCWWLLAAALPVSTTQPQRKVSRSWTPKDDGLAGTVARQFRIRYSSSLLIFRTTRSSPFLSSSGQRDFVHEICIIKFLLRTLNRDIIQTTFLAISLQPERAATLTRMPHLTLSFLFRLFFDWCVQRHHN